MSSALYAIKIGRRQKVLDEQTPLVALNACCSLSMTQEQRNAHSQKYFELAPRSFLARALLLHSKDPKPTSSYKHKV